MASAATIAPCVVTTSCSGSARTSTPPTTASWPCGARPRGWPGPRGGSPRRGTRRRCSSATAAIAHAGRRLAALDIAKDRLLVGRLDLVDGSCLYVGRLAVADEDGDPLVVDWRAPAAEPFYRALPHDPMGVVRRRHFRWRDGELVGLDDEVFDVSAAGEAGLSLVGEGALLAALDAPRTGRMQDVVATIQAEQDVVIRRPRAGVTVVQGAPGTGKTAVALHRAAYLLYAERARLASAVLFVGPSSTFLRYVEDVVPSLGEDRVVLTTPAAWARPSRCRRSTRRRWPRSRAISAWSTSSPGRSGPTSGHRGQGIELGAGRFRLVVEHADLAAIVTTARRRSSTHNAGRPLVERLLLRALEAAYRNRLERDQRIGRIGPEGVRYAPSLLDVVDRGALARALDTIWPVLSPDRLLRRLLASPRRLAAAPGATSSRPTSWTRCSASADGRGRMERGRRRPPRRGRRPARDRPEAAARRPGGDRGSTTWPSGSSRSGCPTARGAGARSSTCRGRRRATTGWTAGSARPRSPRPRSWATPPPTSCTACTRSSPTSSRSRT